MQTIPKIEQLLSQAHSNPAVAQALLAQPITELAKLGIRLPGASDAGVAAHLTTLLPPAVHQRLQSVAQGRGFAEDEGSGGGSTDNGDACMWLVATVAGAMFAGVAVGVGPVLATDAGIIAAAEVLAGAIDGFSASAIAERLALAFNTSVTLTGTAAAGAIAIGVCKGVT